MERRRVKGNISVGVWRDAQGVVGLGTVLAGVCTVGGRMDVVGGERVQVVGGGCAGTARVCFYCQTSLISPRISREPQ